MLSFISSLSPNSEAIAIFVNEKYGYKDNRHILSTSLAQKINSFLGALKEKKEKEDVSSFDISNKQKCFIIKIKNKYESYFPQESGGGFFSYVKKFKDISKIDLYPDSLDFEKQKLVSFFSQFIFGFNLKSYTFNKYKTLNKKNLDKKINFKIITSYKKEIEKSYTYYNCVKEGVFLTRNLVSEPPNILTPKSYVQEIKKLSKLSELQIAINVVMFSYWQEVEGQWKIYGPSMKKSLRERFLPAQHQL